MPLNPAQKQAVEYLGGPLLVLAGPGTGKTQLLSSKVAYILENTDTAPENILCLTYTENGASNMRERLFSIIGQSASGVNIHTYHAFGTDVLSSYKNYATNFDRSLDSVIDSVTQYKIIKDIQEHLDANDILRGDKISDIIETIGNAKNARLSADDLEKIARDNMEVSEAILPDIREALGNLVPRMKFELAVNEVYLPLLKAFQKHAKKEPLAGRIEREVNAHMLNLARILEEENKKEKPSISPLTKWKDRCFEFDENREYRLANVVKNKKLLSLSNIMRKYDERLKEDGLYDFSDMIEEAINILKTDVGFRATLSERYQYILLDEFQDTNPSQAELIYLLTEQDNPDIMAVGDDDQAIFAFQGAKASNLVDFIEHYHAETITLVDNYRSSSRILDFSHKIADQIADSFAKTKNVEKVLTAKTDFSSTEISRDEFLSADGEYYWVAKKIAELVESGVKSSDIAVITPKHKYVTNLLPYLKSRNLNIAYEKRDNLFEDQKISELLKLSHIIYDFSEGRQPRHRLLEIFSFPFWEIEPSVAISACTNINKSDPTHILDHLRSFVKESSNTETKDTSIKNLGNAVDFLCDAIAKAPELPLELFLDHLIRKSPFLSYYENNSSDFETFELYENLAVLRAALNSYLKTETPKLPDLIKFVEDYEFANQPLKNTSPYQDDSDSVQILTAHKSKGLEYKYVFVVATDNMAWGNAKGNNNSLSLPENLISIRHTGATIDEQLRLFFVAITRAKSHLYLTNSKEDFSGKSPARLDFLAEYEDKDGNIISPYLGNLIVTKHYENLDEARKATDLVLNWLARYQKLTPTLRPILESRVVNYRLSASDLTKFIDLTYAGPQEFYKTKLLKLPPEPATTQITLGNLIHATFERVTNQGITDDEALEFYEQEAKKQPLPENDINFLLSRGKEALTTSLKEFAPVLRKDNARGEVNFSHEKLMLDKVPLQGIIDHIDIDEKNKTIEVYDFKTGKFKDKNWNSDASLYKYRLQLGFYKLILNLSPTFSKYQVTRAHILFVTPDHAGKVYDKVYEYNEKDEAELKALATSIYNHVRTLDFIENPDLFLAKDEKKALKDIKKFVKILIS